MNIEKTIFEERFSDVYCYIVNTQQYDLIIEKYKNNDLEHYLVNAIPDAIKKTLLDFFNELLEVIAEKVIELLEIKLKNLLTKEHKVL